MNFFGSGMLQSALVRATQSIVSACKNLYNRVWASGASNTDSFESSGGSNKKTKGKSSGGRWHRYKDLCGRSPVTEYEYGPNYIRVRFGKMKNGKMRADKTYQWTAYSIGESAIEEMKELADYGCGLAKYILSNCAKKASRIY